MSDFIYSAPITRASITRLRVRSIQIEAYAVIIVLDKIDENGNPAGVERVAIRTSDVGGAPTTAGTKAFFDALMMDTQPGEPAGTLARANRRVVQALISAGILTGGDVEV